VSAYSEGPGRGARFTIELPVLRTAPVVVLPTPASAAAASVPGRADVLVVDDERSTAEGLVLALRFRGFPVRMAGTAEQALALIRSQRPRVLLSDVMMPQQSGIDLITALRREEQELQAAPLHAIAMSGRGSPSDRRRLLRAGFDDYVQKPIDIDGLVTRIESALAGPRPHRDHEGVRVLVATGDRALGARLQEGLARSHRQVVTANTAAQARSLAREAFPDLLVVGTQLPDGSGADLARELLEDRQSLRVIGIGAGAGAMAQVFDLLLQEPLDLEALEAGIQTMRPV
jgi:DNA-binding response OmpR family regulator